LPLYHRLDAGRLNGYLAALIAARFAEDFGDDCDTARLGDVLRISTKTANPQDHVGEIWEHYSIPAFDESRRPVMEPATEIKSNKYIVSRNSILISKLNPSIKRFWLPACLTGHPVCSTEFIVFEPIRPENKSFYAAAISSNNFQNYLMAHVSGSTGSRQRAQPKSTLDFPMPNPSERAIRKFCSFADPIYTQMECCARESANLERLRDTLLPKLMSGEIDVSEIEAPTPPNSHLFDC
jgi:type I restriction enzyme S subunit